MREYGQLTEEDRIEIYAMKQAGKKQNKIAAELGVHPSTITRELSRNTGLRGYRPKQAHRYLTRQARSQSLFGIGIFAALRSGSG